MATKYWLGKKRSAETIEKMRIGMKKQYEKGFNPRLGVKHTDDAKAKMSIGHKGKSTWNKGKKGLQIPWNKGTKGLVVSWNKGKKCPQLAGKNNGQWGKGGELSPNWQGGITKENKAQRAIFKKTLWFSILERDNFTCTICNSKTDLQVDHIKPWGRYPKLRFDADNCRTLCSFCHYEITWGRKKPDHVKKWGHNSKSVPTSL